MLHLRRILFNLPSIQENRGPETVEKGDEHFLPEQGSASGNKVFHPGCRRRESGKDRDNAPPSRCVFEYHDSSGAEEDAQINIHAKRE